MKTFEESIEFGNVLEKDYAISLINKLYPACDIKPPPSYRIGKKAVPDHIVTKDKKVVAVLDSKNKSTIYKVRGHEPFFSTDQKHLDYRYFAKMYRCPGYLIFYCAEKDPDHFYLADLYEKPKFYKLINNQFGKHWYGYYLSQCRKIKKADIQ